METYESIRIGKKKKNPNNSDICKAIKPHYFKDSVYNWIFLDLQEKLQSSDSFKLTLYSIYLAKIVHLKMSYFPNHKLIFAQIGKNTKLYKESQNTFNFQNYKYC